MKLLIIGNLNGYMSEASKLAIEQGAEVIFAENTTQAINVLLKGNNISLIFIDITLPIRDFVKSLHAQKITIPVISCGIGSDEDVAANSISFGAKEYLPLPPNSSLIAEILASVSEDIGDLIFKDKKMLEIVNIINKISFSDANILVTGESGTGKEVITKYIHKNSKRSKSNFVALNCAAIPDNLLESELFGHEKGAFTGAIARRIGKFEEANNGTLFLDEISEMNLGLQAKLLRAIQEKEITRVGGSSTIPLNIRIIATSNRNILEYIKEGKFREDLYYRLNVININIPPLRERPDDIEPLTNYFLKKYSELNGFEKTRELSKDALQELKNYYWPGNVRELENAVHRAILLSTSEIIEHFDNLNFIEQNKKDTDSYDGKSLAEIEKEVITSTLNKCLGNKTHTANILGISIRTLRNKLQQYELENAS